MSSIHVSLSLAVANEILSAPDAPGVRVLCKILTMMDLTGCAQSTIKEMKILTARMIEVPVMLCIRSFWIIASVIAQAHTLRKMYRVRQIYRNHFLFWSIWKCCLWEFRHNSEHNAKKDNALHFVNKITIFRRSFQLAITCKILLLNCWKSDDLPESEWLFFNVSDKYNNLIHFLMMIFIISNTCF